MLLIKRNSYFLGLLGLTTSINGKAEALGTYEVHIYHTCTVGNTRQAHGHTTTPVPTNYMQPKESETFALLDNRCLDNCAKNLMNKYEPAKSPITVGCLLQIVDFNRSVSMGIR